VGGREDRARGLARGGYSDRPIARDNMYDYNDELARFLPDRAYDEEAGTRRSEKPTSRAYGQFE